MLAMLALLSTVVVSTALLSTVVSTVVALLLQSKKIAALPLSNAHVIPSAALVVIAVPIWKWKVANITLEAQSTQQPHHFHHLSLWVKEL
jgi:ABC-type sugar transport system permease subunit